MDQVEYEMECCNHQFHRCRKLMLHKLTIVKHVWDEATIPEDPDGPARAARFLQTTETFL